MLETYVNRALEMERDLGISRGDYLRVAQYESGNSASARNPSGAVGLIQFLPSTLKNLGWTHPADEFLKVPEVKQLSYVRRYLAPYKGRMGRLEDVYLAVFSPKYLGSDLEYKLYSKDADGYGGLAYKLNANLDENGDGHITPAELGAAARRSCRGPRWRAIARIAGLGDSGAMQATGTPEWLQAKLLSAGFSPGDIDGIWGPESQKALVAFQKAKGLVPDGIVGPKTLMALG